MSEQHDGGPAFPVAENHAVAADIGWTCGMSLRDYFAAAALTGIMANPERWKDIAARYEAGRMSYDDASASNATKAYSIADAMLRARGAGMTPAELREAVARAMWSARWAGDLADAVPSARQGYYEIADAALRVVREAMREATPAMCAAWECSVILGPHASFEELAKRDWAAMFAVSPLREE